MGDAHLIKLLIEFTTLSQNNTKDTSSHDLYKQGKLSGASTSFSSQFFFFIYIAQYHKSQCASGGFTIWTAYSIITPLSLIRKTPPKYLWMWGKKCKNSQEQQLLFILFLRCCWCLTSMSQQWRDPVPVSDSDLEAAPSLIIGIIKRADVMGDEGVLCARRMGANYRAQDDSAAPQWARLSLVKQMSWLMIWLVPRQFRVRPACCDIHKHTQTPDRSVFCTDVSSPLHPGVHVSVFVFTHEWLCGSFCMPLLSELQGSLIRSLH